MSAPARKRFVEGACEHGKAMLEGNPQGTSDAYERLNGALKELREADDSGNAFLRMLLEHDDPSVATWAALYLLPHDETAAISALERVAELKLPLLSFGAEMILQEWRAGRLEIE